MQYELKVFKPASGLTLLKLEGLSKEDVQLKTEADGNIVISIRELRSATFRLRAAKNKFDIYLFSQELLALMDAGMVLVEALEMLSERASGGRHIAILKSVFAAVREGRTFSTALTMAEGVFPSLFIAAIKASEHTGDINTALRRYITYHKQTILLKSRLTTASIYPLILIVVGAVVVIFLLTYVVPRFSRVYADLGEERLPLLSKFLMHIGSAIGNHLTLFFSAFFLLLLSAIYGATRPALRASFERALWHMPRIGPYLKMYQLSRFTRTVAMLLKGGTPLVTALGMTGALLDNALLKNGLQSATSEIEQGRSLADCFQRHGLATDVGIRLLSVGARSGDLGEAMEKIADFYDDDIAQGIEWFSKAFEPALMVGMGFLIGGIVILMYLPIFQLASSIQ